MIAYSKSWSRTSTPLFITSLSPVFSHLSVNSYAIDQYDILRLVRRKSRQVWAVGTKGYA